MNLGLYLQMICVIIKIQNLAFNNYDVLLEGGERQLLTKMKTFWEYLAPQADRKVLKAIHKSTNISKYYQAVGAFFNQR